jgi:fermentation-respiration switch protein FrsA (DUF1100 family)
MTLSKKQKISIVVVISALLLLYFSFCAFAAHIMTSPLAPHIDITPNFISDDWRSAEFKSTDGVQLRGWFFEGQSTKAVIMVSGLFANRTNSEYMGSIIAKELIFLGYNVLLYDTRAHGKSDGDRVGFGSVEGEDIVGAVKFLNSQGFASKDIAIIGDSMGAISTLMVVDKLKEVGAIVLDTPASEFAPILSSRLWVERGVPGFFHPTIFFFSKVFFGVDVYSVKPIDKISLDNKRKLLFLHGKLDQTTPVINSETLIKKAGKGSRLILFEEGSHIETFKSDPKLYRKEVYSFLESELSSTK